MDIGIRPQRPEDSALPAPCTTMAFTPCSRIVLSDVATVIWRE